MNKIRSIIRPFFLLLLLVLCSACSSNVVINPTRTAVPERPHVRELAQVHFTPMLAPSPSTAEAKATIEKAMPSLHFNRFSERLSASSNTALIPVGTAGFDADIASMPHASLRSEEHYRESYELSTPLYFGGDKPADMVLISKENDGWFTGLRFRTSF